MSPRQKLFASAVLPLFALSMTACGGGGGGGGSSVVMPLPPPPPAPPPPPPPPPPPAVPPSDFETSEYNRTVGLPIIGASSAYAEGATGQGITVAVVDTDTDPDHPELEGQVLSTSFDVFQTTRDADDIDSSGHGTLVSGVLAARKDDSVMHGIAFESDILAIRADRPGSCQEEGEDEGCRFPDSALVTAIDRAVQLGARVINLSLGGEIDADRSLENAVQRAAAAGVLVVVSAGNEAEPAGPSEDDPATVLDAEGTRPTEPAYIAGENASLGRVVAVGSIDPNRVISDFSNRAGDAAKNFYILAPGEDIVTSGPDDDIVFPDGEDNDADDEGDYYRVSGTSFAAPYVSGALALMLDLFPNMTPEDALSALLESADDYVDETPDLIRDEPAGVGIDAVSGVGILNLEAAFAPQGATSLQVNGERVATTSVMGPTGGAFGDWASDQKTGLGQLVFLDKFNRAYRFNASLIPSAGANIADLQLRADTQLGERRAVQAGPVRFSWQRPALRDDPLIPYEEETPTQFSAVYEYSDGTVEFGRGGGAATLAPELSLINEPGARTGFAEGSWARVSRDVGPVRMDIFSSDNEGLSASGFGISRLADTWTLRAFYSDISDERTALGSGLQSRFGGEDASELSAYGLEGAWLLAPDLKLSAGLEAASVSLPGLDADGIWTSRWSLGLARASSFGDFRVRIAQPRRAETGSFRFEGLTGVGADGVLSYQTVTAALTPSGREIDYEASWHFDLPLNLRAGLTAALSTSPNHVSGAESAEAAWFTLATTW